MTVRQKARFAQSPVTFRHSSIDSALFNVYLVGELFNVGHWDTCVGFADTYVRHQCGMAFANEILSKKDPKMHVISTLCLDAGMYNYVCACL